MNRENVRILLIMGVSSSGKTTIGQALSRELNWPFFDGDDFHPAANVEKMRMGQPLNDEERKPWLAAIRAEIERQIATGQSAIFACSALKQIYREQLIGGISQAISIHLVAPQKLVQQRANARVHQYMPAGLVKSQYEALEPPQDAISISVEGTVAEAVNDILQRIHLKTAPISDG